MCGICGIVYDENSKRPVNKSLLCAMCDVIVHRGPDEDGLFYEKNIGLGMRRLKIIDLSTGKQPIFNEDKSVVVVFNGEIYNFPELRDELLTKGHTFYTHSDTEVLAHLYEEHGEEFLKYLNGMFGIALWDKKCRKLILARDRLGEKPLYYTNIQDGLIFASELKSILCYPALKKEMDHEAIYHYFSFNYIPAPLTIYKNIFKLLPGQYLTYQNRKLTVKKYWEASFFEKSPLSEEEISERLYEILIKAVKLRMISDVPLGAFLSGGIDSSIMVSLMSHITDSPIKTFSIGLKDDKESELPYARAVAEKYRTDHKELIAKPDALKLVHDIAWHFDEPFGDSSAIPTYLVSRLTRDYVTVAISGDGGDELFGGYNRYLKTIISSKIDKIPLPLRSLLALIPGDILPFGSPGKAFFQSLRYSNYYRFALGTSEELKSLLFSKDFKSTLKGFSSYQIVKHYCLCKQSLLNQCMYFDTKVYLPDDILTKVDRMSMACSLETRAPFLDHNLVEFALTIPETYKIKGNITKYILKKSFKDFLPDEIFSRGKAGFSIPLDRWFRNELRPFILDTLSDKRIREMGIFSTAFINKVLNLHINGKRNYKRLLWMIMMFYLWHENFFKQNHFKIKQALRNRGIV